MEMEKQAIDYVARRKTNKIIFKVFGVIILLFLILIIVSSIKECNMTPEEKAIRDSVSAVELQNKTIQDSLNNLEKIRKDSIKDAEEYHEKNNSSKSMAIMFAEEYILTKLKSPSTADFCSNSEYEYRNISTGEWGLAGYVDSKNSFNAEVRSKFVIVVKYNGNGDSNFDNWEVKEFAFMK